MSIFQILNYFGWPAIILIVVLFIIKNPEKIDKWSNLFYRCALWMGEKREKRIISSELDYRITKVARQINRESEGILPYGIRIKWKNPEEVQSFVQKNNVVIVLRKKDNFDKNIVDACRAFVPMAVVPKARRSLYPDINTSIDIHVIEKILLSGHYTSAYNFYEKSVVDVEIANNRQLRGLLKTIADMDEKGFFARILLSEFKVLGDLLFGTSEPYKLRNETRDFVSFLAKLATREPGDDSTPLSFNGQKIKIGVILVAKKATFQRWGVDAYIKRIRSLLEQGIQRLYIFSYAQITDRSILDKEGYVIDVRRGKEFVALSQIEDEIRKVRELRLLKKQNYYAKDSKNNLRTTKYYVYETSGR